MKKKHHRSLNAVGLLYLFIAFGCANYGKILAVPRGENDVSIDRLKKTWDDYSIYESDGYSGNTICILFDPKDDDRKLLGETWTMVENLETLLRQIDGIKIYSGNFPTLYSMLGPKNRLFGYLYCGGYYHTVTKVLDDKTLYVYGPQLPIGVNSGNFF